MPSNVAEPHFGQTAIYTHVVDGKGDSHRPCQSPLPSTTFISLDYTTLLSSNQKRLNPNLNRKLACFVAFLESAVDTNCCTFLLLKVSRYRGKCRRHSLATLHQTNKLYHIFYQHLPMRNYCTVLFSHEYPYKCNIYHIINLVAFLKLPHGSSSLASRKRCKPANYFRKWSHIQELIQVSLRPLSSNIGTTSERNFLQKEGPSIPSVSATARGCIPFAFTPTCYGKEAQSLCTLRLLNLLGKMNSCRHHRREHRWSSPL